MAGNPVLVGRLYIWYNFIGQRPTRDDGNINPNTKVCEQSQRGRKIGRPGKEDGAMVNIPRIKIVDQNSFWVFDT